MRKAMRVRALLTVVIVSAVTGSLWLSLPAHHAAAQGGTLEATNADAWKGVWADDKSFDDAIKVLAAECSKTTRSSALFSRGRRKLESRARSIAMIANAKILISGDKEVKEKAATLRDAAIKLGDACKARNKKEAGAQAKIIASWGKDIKPTADASFLPWEKVISRAQLMKQVARIDTETKAIMNDAGDYKDDHEEFVTYALLQASLGLAARDMDKNEDWKKFCDDMTKAAKDMAVAFKDPKGRSKIQDINQAMQKSCTECHEKYRPES